MCFGSMVMKRRVNAVAFTPDGNAVSAGDDFAVMLWDVAGGRLLWRFEGHTGKVMGVAVSPDGGILASAAWDGRIGLWDAATGERIAWLADGIANVNGVAFSADGSALWSVSYDGFLRRWDLASGTDRVIYRHGFGLNVLVLGTGWVAVGGLDGGVKVLDLEGEELADLSADRRPVLAMALSPDGERLAIGDGEGYIQVAATKDWKTERDFHAVARGPVWALAFTGDSQGLISGGLDDFATLWPLDEAASVAESDAPHRFHLSEGLSNGERQFARKCSICHSLEEDGKRRAGPTLHGVFGRRAGSLPGYVYSDALKGSEIIWSEETIDLLFDLGPDHYTPGSKMPMQQIAGADDRADLIAFLKEATGETP